MKVSFIGNCQLEVIGNLIKANKTYFDKYSIEIVWNTPLYKLGDSEIPNLFATLENSDYIFHQYHGQNWGKYSTENITKYFNVTLVPTLESPVSSPQLGYWSRDTRISENYIYIDYRLLQLYLEGVTFTDAQKQYTLVQLNNEKNDNLIKHTANRYHNIFLKGQRAFDYSQFYLSEIKKIQTAILP